MLQWMYVCWGLQLRKWYRRRLRAGELRPSECSSYILEESHRDEWHHYLSEMKLTLAGGQLASICGSSGLHSPRGSWLPALPAPNAIRTVITAAIAFPEVFLKYKIFCRRGGKIIHLFPVQLVLFQKLCGAVSMNTDSTSGGKTDWRCFTIADGTVRWTAKPSG